MSQAVWSQHNSGLVFWTHVNMGKIECGVPQGSVLGPLSFPIYLNDIQNAVGPENLRLFADDTALFMSHTNLTQLLCDIKTKFKHLIKWCNSNKLTINAVKTNCILFYTINKPIPRNLDEISFESMTIKRVNSFKYLGLTLDETLHWNGHVNELCKSLVKYFGIFNHIKNEITTKVARQLYYVFSSTKYDIAIYGSTSISNVNRLQVMQNKLLNWYWN